MSARSIDGICDACKHIWPIAQLPMSPVCLARLLLSATCPHCTCITVFLAPSTATRSDRVGFMERLLAC